VAYSPSPQPQWPTKAVPLEQQFLTQTNHLVKNSFDNLIVFLIQSG
jgi:hypothetical protein